MRRERGGESARKAGAGAGAGGDECKRLLHNSQNLLSLEICCKSVVKCYIPVVSCCSVAATLFCVIDDPLPTTI